MSPMHRGLFNQDTWFCYSHHYCIQVKRGWTKWWWEPSSFFQYNSSFLPWAIFLRVKVLKSNTNEKFATIFMARSCKICHILHNFVHNRHHNRHIALYNQYCELEDGKSKNCPLSFAAPLGEWLFWPHFSGFPVPVKLLSNRTYAQVPSIRFSSV